MKDLENRVALVTGGSRGIGVGITLALARAGADVAVNYRERADAAKAVCNEIRVMGRNAIPIQANVSVSADVKRMVKEVEHFLGNIDILVNNAAIAKPRQLEDISESEWDEMLSVNLKSQQPESCLGQLGRESQSPNELDSLEFGRAQTNPPRSSQSGESENSRQLRGGRSPLRRGRDGQE